jgi:hypothetical protein
MAAIDDLAGIAAVEALTPAAEAPPLRKTVPFE